MMGDTASASVFVRVAQADAFDVFTREVDLWWRQGPQFRIAGRRRGRICFEGGLGGRLFESFDGRTFETGKITLWEPPARFEFEWRGVNFKPHERTKVEVTFASSGGGTMVTVRHSGWSALPDDHPVRHGNTGVDFSRMIGVWWGQLMTSLREHVERRG